LLVSINHLGALGTPSCDSSPPTRFPKLKTPQAQNAASSGEAGWVGGGRSCSNTLLTAVENKAWANGERCQISKLIYQHIQLQHTKTARRRARQPEQERGTGGQGGRGGGRTRGMELEREGREMGKMDRGACDRSPKRTFVSI